MSQRRSRAGLVVLLMLVGVAALGWQRWQQQRSVQDAALPQPAAQASAELPLELGTQDVARVQSQLLATSLPISGTVKAMHTALVKARVAGELQDLSVREGDTVQAGQLLATIQPTEYRQRLRQVEQQLEGARAQTAIAQRQHANNQALVAEGFISPTALQNSEASLQAARASQQAAAAAVEVTRQAVLDTQIKAPITGQIAQRLAQSGERVQPEARIVEIIDPRALELEATLNPADALAVQVGQGAELSIEGATQTLSAQVARINPGLQAGSRKLQVYLALPPDAGLRHGLFAQGRLLTGTQQALAVPLLAVRTDQPQAYVQAIDTASTPARVLHLPVRTGVRALVEGQTWVAVDGLDEGQWVLLPSAGSLAAGTAVQLPRPAPAAES